MTVVIDDHLLRDYLARPDGRLLAAVDGEPLATTNLWYTRLCKSAARASGGAILAGWRIEERRALIATLVALPEDIIVTPMRQLAWTMGELAADHNGLSTLGAEAVAAAIVLNARLLVSSRDDGRGIRQCCQSVHIRYDALSR